jgi:hypothetical protein
MNWVIKKWVIEQNMLISKHSQSELHMQFKQGPTGLAFTYSLLPEVATLMAIWTTTETVPVEWDNPVPLIDYVHSLHHPRWQVRDPTITLSDPTHFSGRFTI